jgi:pantoate--beta-alanine ligase
MRVINSADRMSSLAESVRKKGKKIGFVPTMGYLHEGHLSLVRRARKDADIVAVSIYVNPTQFGPKEDFKRYPRDLKRDLSLCRRENVDFVFVPSSEQIYPEGFSTYVNVEGLSESLCGAKRPGHFKGVATIVNKLFCIVKPDIAYFGQKDAQQAMIIKRMVLDLDMNIKVKVLPIVREPDGLAMSSRNKYLSLDERKRALVLFRSLQKAGDMIKSGESNPRIIVNKMRDLIKKQRPTKIDYISLVDTKELKPVKKIKGEVLVAVAVYFGRTRLIDNIKLKV